MFIGLILGSPSRCFSKWE